MNRIDPSREIQLIRFLSLCADQHGPAVQISRSSTRAQLVLVADADPPPEALALPLVRAVLEVVRRRAATVGGAVHRRAGVVGVGEAVAVRVGVAGAVGAGREGVPVAEDEAGVRAAVVHGQNDPVRHRRLRLDRRQRQRVRPGRKAVDAAVAVLVVDLADRDLVADASHGRGTLRVDRDVDDGSRVGARPHRDGVHDEQRLDRVGRWRHHAHSPEEERCGHEAAKNPTHVEPSFPAVAELGF